MSFDDPLVRNEPRLTTRHYFWIVALILVLVVLAFVMVNRAPRNAIPTSQATASAAKSSEASTAGVQAGPLWHELTDAQREILRPLASTWNSLGYAHKNKWIALATNYPNRSSEDQEKLQSRMAEWSALSPRDRERARLNFAETKKLRTSTLAAEWAAYQELSPEEKQSLAQKAKTKPVGATVSLAPAPYDKLTPAATTRRTGQLPESSAAAKPQIDPNTLLPKTIALAPGTLPGSTTDTQAPPVVERSSPVISADTLSPN